MDSAVKSQLLYLLCNIDEDLTQSKKELVNIRNILNEKTKEENSRSLESSTEGE